MERKKQVSIGSATEHNKICAQIIVEISKENLGFGWINETGAAYRNGGLVRYGLIGSSDLIVVLRGGYVVFTEVKTGRAIQSKGQVMFEAAVKKYGGYYNVARSVQEAIDYYKHVATKAIV